MSVNQDIDFGIPDIRGFAKPEGYYLFSASEEETETEVADLVAYLGEIYPDHYPYYAAMPEWWTEEDMLNEAEVLQPMDFAIWMLDHLEPENDEEGLVNTWLSSLKSEIGDEIILYRFEDDGRDSPGFVPYIFEGERCLIIAVRYWAYY